MSSAFISENEILEARKQRQEEWDRVRKPDDPLERPEEPYDPRSLYDKLQEQKQKKDLEYEEAHKLKNMIKGLDDDEIEFLDLVDRTKLAADRKKEIEEELELNDYRNRVATLQEKSLEERLQAEIGNKPKSMSVSNRTSQQKLLKGVVVRKRKMSDEISTSEPTDDSGGKQVKVEEDGSVESNAVGEVVSKGSEKVGATEGLKCVAILPGLGCYNDSSSDENSSDSEIEQPVSKVDMLGRKVVTKTKES